jgi:hypothetical protein
MEEKTRKLLLTLELLAIATAAILILIDYKLKQDLLKLFERIETAIGTEQHLFDANTSKPGNSSNIPGSPMVGDNTIMETSDIPDSANGHGASRQATSKRAAANGNGRTRNTTIPDPDKSMGT